MQAVSGARDPVEVDVGDQAQQRVAHHFELGVHADRVDGLLVGDDRVALRIRLQRPGQAHRRPAVRGPAHADRPPAQDRHVAEGPEIGAPGHQGRIAYPVGERLEADELGVDVEREADLGVIEAERVGIPAHQRPVPDRGRPELARDRVHRIALVPVADEADEPGEVLRLVPVALADQPAVRLRLAREAADAALIVVPDHHIERHRKPEPYRSQAELGVDHGRGVGALALDVGHRQAHVRARRAAEQTRRRIPECPVARGRIGRRRALRLLRNGGGGDQDSGGENARSHGRLQSVGAIRRYRTPSGRSEKTAGAATRGGWPFPLQRRRM